mmetsp:Transcript_5282/g.9448  ORF Transcript_5282/g.9448 Transcript_5282/m.9448 type:complete len:259 (+) Transcript_5282:253-1029(+)
MCLRWVHLRGEESSLGTTSVGLNEFRNRKSICQDLLGILGWGRKKLFEVGIFWFLLIASIVPGLDGFSSPNDYVEECIQQKDDVWLQRCGIQQHRLRRPFVEGILQQSRLNHDERVHCALAKNEHSVVCGFIGASVEGLQEVAAPQMVHELWEDSELRAQLEARGLVLAIICKLGDQANQHAVNPTQHVQWILVLAFEDSVPGHKNGCSLLVETLRDVCHLSICVSVRHCGHAQPLPARRMQVTGLKLQEGLLALPRR